MEQTSKHLKRPALNWFWRGVVMFVRLMTIISCLALGVMVLITCGDVILRTLHMPVKGVYDLVQLCGAVAVASAIPMTTAVKGHVAIEYFFLKFNRRGRVIIDSMMRTIVLIGFSVAAWSSFHYGLSFLKNNEVTNTVEVPVFWVPWLMSLAFAVTALVILFHLIYPGRELAKV